MAITRINKKDMANNGASYSFNGGSCDCVIVKNIGGSAGVTYGGVAMKKLTEVSDTSVQVYQIWGLQNAPSGTVTVSGMDSFNSIETYRGVSGTATFPNVSGVAEHHFGSGSLAGIQIDLTTTEDDCVLVALGSYRGPGVTALSPGGDATLISVYPSGSSSGEDLSMESNPLVTGAAGLYSLSAITGGGSPGIIISLSVAALTPGTSISTQSTVQAIII